MGDYLWLLLSVCLLLFIVAAIFGRLLSVVYLLSFAVIHCCVLLSIVVALCCLLVVIVSCGCLLLVVYCRLLFTVVGCWVGTVWLLVVIGSFLLAFFD